MSIRFFVTVAAGFAIAAGMADAQAPIPPVNYLPNPYQTIKDWAKLPEGRTWGSTSAVDIDKDGKSIWVGRALRREQLPRSRDRADVDLPTVLKFDATGKLVKSFGAGLLIFPHGIFVDRDGNVWVTDGQDNAPRPRAVRRRGRCAARLRRTAARRPAGSRAQRQSGLQVQPGRQAADDARQAGRRGRARLLLSAERRARRAQRRHLRLRGTRRAATIAILKFAKDGKFIKSWGKQGTGPGEFDQPHALAIDSQRPAVRRRPQQQPHSDLRSGRQVPRASGAVQPAERHLHRQERHHLRRRLRVRCQYPRTHDGWKRGIRIGSAKDGLAKYFIPDPVEKATSTSAAEGVVVDAQGNVYGAEVGPRTLMKMRQEITPAAGRQRRLSRTLRATPVFE